MSAVFVQLPKAMSLGVTSHHLSCCGMWSPGTHTHCCSHPSAHPQPSYGHCQAALLSSPGKAAWPSSVAAVALGTVFVQRLCSFGSHRGNAAIGSP